MTGRVSHLIHAPSKTTIHTSKSTLRNATAQLTKSFGPVHTPPSTEGLTAKATPGRGVLSSMQSIWPLGKWSTVRHLTCFVNYSRQSTFSKSWIYGSPFAILGKLRQHLLPFFLLYCWDCGLSLNTADWPYSPPPNPRTSILTVL